METFTVQVKGQRIQCPNCGHSLQSILPSAWVRHMRVCGKQRTDRSALTSP